MELQSLSPAAFCEWLVRERIRRFYLVWDEEAGRVRASHPAVEPLARMLEDHDERARRDAFELLADAHALGAAAARAHRARLAQRGVGVLGRSGHSSRHE